MAEIRKLKDLKTGETFFPATIGDAVAVEGKRLTVHIKRLAELDTKVQELDKRTVWK